MLETDRLFLRFFELKDAESFFQLNLDTEVMKYTGDVEFESVEATRSFLDEYLKRQKPGFGRMSVLEKETGKCIGWCGLRPMENGDIDLGYRFVKDSWGHGYATEAALASLKYGFEKMNLNKIIGRTARANVASVRVLEKIGMKFWKNDACEGIDDSVYYHITSEEWKEKPLNF